MSEFKLIQLLPKLVDREVGIIKYISEIPLQCSEPDIYIAVGEFQNSWRIPPRNINIPTNKIDTPFGIDNKQASGAGLDRLSCLWSTIGEVVERYSAAIYAPDTLIRATFDELEGEALDPRAVIGFSDHQYAEPTSEFVKFSSSRPYDWIEGFNLTKKETAFIPASYNYLGYTTNNPDEVLDHSYSTGLAAGPSLAAAAHTAIREVIERDAYACHWFVQKMPPRMRESFLKANLSDGLMKLVVRDNGVIAVSDITTEFSVPCVVSQLQPHNKKGISTGASCHPNWRLAVEKSLIEAYHTYNWTLDLLRWEGPIDKEQIQTFRDHVRFYLAPSNYENVSFLFGDSESSGVIEAGLYHYHESDGCESIYDITNTQVQELCERLYEHGYEVFLADITSSDVRELGFAVVRAIIPGLQPLYCGYGNQHQDTRRLRKFCDFFGHPFPDLLNSKPHPFP